MKFHIITAMYNVEEWIEENIQALKEQTYAEFQVILVDDLSTDDTVKLVQAAIQDDDRFHLIVNQEKKFKTRNVVEAIEAANPGPEDVIVMVDGDDRLAHKDVLTKLKSVYRQQDCWMTYGSFGDSQGVRDKGCRPYKKSIIDGHRFRQTKWIAYHLKTFKFKLWKQLSMDIFHISDGEVKNVLLRTLFKLRFRTWRRWKGIKAKDLHDSSGKYIKRVDDKAFSYPMLEMSGDRACFIEEMLYIFRAERTPYNGPDQNYGKDKSEKWHTRLVREILLHKKPYKRLEQL
jgi:glycosyltransferase involved in cell wall biosynthesis